MGSWARKVSRMRSASSRRDAASAAAPGSAAASSPDGMGVRARDEAGSPDDPGTGRHEGATPARSAWAAEMTTSAASGPRHPCPPSALSCSSCSCCSSRSSGASARYLWRRNRALPASTGSRIRAASARSTACSPGGCWRARTPSALPASRRGSPVARPTPTPVVASSPPPSACRTARAAARPSSIGSRSREAARWSQSAARSGASPRIQSRSSVRAASRVSVSASRATMRPGSETATGAAARSIPAPVAGSDIGPPPGPPAPRRARE